MLTICETLLRCGIASATRTAFISSTLATSQVWCRLRHHSQSHTDRQHKPGPKKQQTYSPQQLTTWLADTSVKDANSMEIIELNSQQHITKDPSLLLFSPSTLVRQLQAIAKQRQLLLKNYTAASKLLYMCTLTTIQQASSGDALQLMASSIQLRMFDQDMAQTLLHRLASIDGDDKRISSISMVLDTVAGMKKSGWLRSDDMMEAVGQAVDKDLWKTSNVTTLTNFLSAVCKLGLAAHNIKQLSAIVDRIVDHPSSWSPSSGIRTLELLADLERRQMLQLRAAQCKACGDKISSMVDTLDAGGLIRLLNALSSLGTSQRALQVINCCAPDMLGARISTLLGTCTASSILDLLDALNALQLHPTKTLNLDINRIGRVINIGLDGLSVSEICKLLDVCSQLNLDPMKQLDLDLSKLSVLMAKALEDNPTGLEVAKTLRLLHRHGIQLIDHLKLDPARIGGMVNEMIGKANSTSIVGLVVMLASLRVDPKHYLSVDLERLGSLINASLDEWNAKALSIVLVSLSLLRVDLVADLHINVRRLGQVVRQSLRHWDPLSATNMLVAMQHLNVHPVRDLGLDPTELGQCIRANLGKRSWDPRMVANMLGALVQLKLDPEADLGLDKKQWERMIASTLTTEKTLTSQSNLTLSQTLRSLGKLGANSSRMPWARVAAQLVHSLDLEHPDARTCLQASVALQGCVKLYYRPPAPLLHNLLNCIAQSIANGEPDMEEAGARALLACFQLAWLPPEETLETIVRHVVNHYRVDKSQMRVNTLYAVVGLLCMFDKLETLRRLMPQLRMLLPDAPTNESNLRQIKAAQLACQIMGVGTLLPNHVVPAYTWPSGQTQGRQVRVSALQNKVVSVLQSLDVFAHIVEEWPVLEDTSSVDALCTTHDGVRVVVEVNGPVHFFVNQRQTANGATRFKHTLLTHQGLMVVSIHHEALNQESPEMFRESVVCVLQQQGVNV